MNKRSRTVWAVTILTAILGLAACSKAPATAPAATAVSGPVASVPNVSDIDVTEHVKTALNQNDALKGFDITVITLKGDVRLIGVLDSQAQVDEALKIARAADGAHAIHDELTIKK